MKMVVENTIKASDYTINMVLLDMRKAFPAIDRNRLF